MLEHLIVQQVERYTVRRASNVIIKAPFAVEFVRSLNSRAKVFLLEIIVHEAYFAVEPDPSARPKASIAFVPSLALWLSKTRMRVGIASVFG